MIKDQFVTYEIALKLKELGFDKSCFAIYKSSSDIELAHSINDSYFYHNSNLHGSISAPLWQQAISFLKRKGILVNECWHGWDYGAYEWDDFIHVDSREQAILKALDLIK